MAIDYGLKRVGLAVTDPLQLIASPLTTVPTNDVLAFLQTYVQKEPVEAFIVGYPGDIKDNLAPIVVAIRNFVQLLHKHFPEQQILQHDERYTSKLAVASLVEGGFKKKDRRKKENIDKLSATIILQSFLSSYKRNYI
jgi:putative Holliday junction resolvase